MRDWRGFDVDLRKRFHPRMSMKPVCNCLAPTELGNPSMQIFHSHSKRIQSRPDGYFRED